MPRTHQCPGGCGADVEEYRLACPLCWYRLPKDLRTAIWQKWQTRKTDPFAHLRACTMALKWYRLHPRFNLLSSARRPPQPNGQPARRHDNLYPPAPTPPEEKTP